MLRPRQDHDYVIPDSDDEDMEENPEEIQQGHPVVCTSADPRWIGAGGGETIILNPEELREAITFHQSTDDQSV